MRSARRFLLAITAMVLLLPFRAHAADLDQEVVAYMEHTHSGDPYAGTGCYENGPVQANEEEDGTWISSDGEAITGTRTDVSTAHAAACGRSQAGEEADHVGKITLSSDNDGNYNPGGSVTLTCSVLYYDETSGEYSSFDPSVAGVSGVTYSWTGSNFRSLTQNANANQKTVTENGSYSCYVRYTEGGIEKTTQLVISVKSLANSAPEVEIVYDTTSQDYFTSNVITLNTSSPLAEAPYSFDNGATWTTSNKYLVEKNGYYRIKVKDAYGNIWSGYLKVSNIDNKAPTITSLTANTTAWVSAQDSVMLSVSATDNGAGLPEEPEKAYSWDGGNTWTTYNTYAVKKNGTYVVLVQDKLGNTASRTIYISNIDDSAPYFITSTPGTWNSGLATLKVTAYDSDSGLAELPYSFDNGKTWSSSATKTISEGGSYLVKVRDMVGNESFQKVEVKKDGSVYTSDSGRNTTSLLTDDVKKMQEIIAGAGEVIIDTGTKHCSEKNEISQAEDQSGMNDFAFSDPSTGYTTNNYEDTSRDSLSYGKITNQNSYSAREGDVLPEKLTLTRRPIVKVSMLTAGAGILIYLTSRIVTERNEKHGRRKKR